MVTISFVSTTQSRKVVSTSYTKDFQPRDIINVLKYFCDFLFLMEQTMRGKLGNFPVGLRSFACCFGLVMPSAARSFMTSRCTKKDLQALSVVYSRPLICSFPWRTPRVFPHQQLSPPAPSLWRPRPPPRLLHQRSVTNVTTLSLLLYLFASGLIFRCASITLATWS